MKETSKNFQLLLGILVDCCFYLKPGPGFQFCSFKAGSRTYWSTISGACESTAGRVLQPGFPVLVLRTTWLIRNLLIAGSGNMVHLLPASSDPVGMEAFCFLWEEDPKVRKRGRNNIFVPTEDAEASSAAAPASLSGLQCCHVITACSPPCSLFGISWQNQPTLRKALFPMFLNLRGKVLSSWRSVGALPWTSQGWDSADSPGPRRLWECLLLGGEDYTVPCRHLLLPQLSC